MFFFLKKIDGEVDVAEDGNNFITLDWKLLSGEEWHRN